MYELMTNPVFVAALMVLMAAAIGLCIWALKTGRVTSEMLTSGTAMLEGVQCAADALAKATKNPAVSVASYIMKAAAQAARAAEQMYNTGEISAQERNATAKKIAGDLLSLAGIEVTEDRKTAIAVLLEAECDAMGHHTDPVEHTDTVLEADESQLMVDDWTDEQLRLFLAENAPHVDISCCTTREELLAAFDIAFPADDETREIEVIERGINPSHDEPVDGAAHAQQIVVQENPSHD